MTDRLPPETFDLPVTELRAGYRSAIYFNRAKMILEREKPDHVVTMQVFQKKDAVLCGIDEALAVLQVAAGSFTDPEKAAQLFESYLTHKQNARRYYLEDPLKAAEYTRHAAGYAADMNRLWEPGVEQLHIEALHDGDAITPWEPVLHITGPLHLFVHLESVYLGILARQTKIATNVRCVSDECKRKPLLFFADRFDRFENQGSDGYAAHVGGASGVASDSMARWWGEKGLGTMPHALIAAYEGLTGAATEAFHKHVPEADLIALVDFNNDCVSESIICAQRFGDALWGVRLDTSETMVDVSVIPDGKEKPIGVNPLLVHAVRKELDDGGWRHVKIIVSGGFNAEKIHYFESKDVPVDAYAVGSSLLQGSYDFTADCVLPVAKAGRNYRRLKGRDATKA